jgi:hypothetical protein
MVLALAAAFFPAAAMAGDSVLVPDGSEYEAPYRTSPELYEPDYFEKQAGMKAEERRELQQAGASARAAADARRDAQIGEDQSAVKARARDAASQPSDYAGRRQGLKAAPPVIDTPETQPPETQPGPGPSPRPVTGGGGSGGGGPVPPTRGDDSRSVMERMMDAVQ